MNARKPNIIWTNGIFKMEGQADREVAVGLWRRRNSVHVLITKTEMETPTTLWQLVKGRLVSGKRHIDVHPGLEEQVLSHGVQYGGQQRCGGACAVWTINGKTTVAWLKYSLYDIPVSHICEVEIDAQAALRFLKTGNCEIRDNKTDRG